MSLTKNRSFRSPSASSSSRLATTDPSSINWYVVCVCVWCIVISQHAALDHTFDATLYLQGRGTSVNIQFGRIWKFIWWWVHEVMLINHTIGGTQVIHLPRYNFLIHRHMEEKKQRRENAKKAQGATASSSTTQSNEGGTILAEHEAIRQQSRKRELEDVRVWSDFLSVGLKPSSVYELGNYKWEIDSFDVWTEGLAVFANETEVYIYIYLYCLYILYHLS